MEKSSAQTADERGVYFMDFTICRVSGHPEFETLPIAKISSYPLERRDYKPFAQCRLAVAQGELFVRMWAFEVSPEPCSALECLLCPKDDEQSALLVKICANAANTVAIAGEDITLAQFSAHPLSGDDLQGEYWGATVGIPLDIIAEKTGGRLGFDSGEECCGNFYKICEGQKKHYGSFVPANWEKPYAMGSLGLFKAVDF